jgi:hypothetical protein
LKKKRKKGKKISFWGKVDGGNVINITKNEKQTL